MRKSENNHRRRIEVLVPGHNSSNHIMVIPDSYEPEKFMRKQLTLIPQPVE